MFPRARIRPFQRSFPHRHFSLAALAPATLAIVLGGAAHAQDAGADTAPPALVGRIASVQGSASLLRPGDQDWEQAGVNEPISIGDAVYSQDNSGVAVEIGATDLRLQPDTEMDVPMLDDQTGQLRLDSGVVDLRVAALPTADGLFIDTPRGTVKLTQPGIYRIDAGTQDQPTTVTAWNGQAELGTTGTVVIQPSQMMLINGTVDAPQYSYQPAPGGVPAEFAAPVRVVSAEQHYVAPDMTGAEDLYQYGSFRTEQQYGAVWYPTNVPADWQPYRYGHWEYVAPWGQTWIDDQPWGFAPFHYGRWAYVGNRWGWVPGEYTPHPVYAPALVAFIGGGGFSAAISFGGGAAIGWVPLGPGEAYRPPYHVSQTYIENINKTVVINKTVINNFGPGGERPVASLANARFATVVPAAALASGRPVAAAVIKVQPRALEHVSASPQVVAELPRPTAPVRPAAKAGPVKPVAVTRGGPVARPALPSAHGPAAGKPGRPAAPAAQQEEPARPGATPPKTPPTPPGRPEAGRPEAGRPEAGKPEATRPEAQRPEAARPEPAKPEAAHPEAQRPQAPRPETQHPEAAHPESPRPEAQRPEAARPEAPRPEAARPEAQRPEPRKPEPAKPEAQHAEPRPEAQRPEAQRPEAQRPEAQRPEPRKPEPAKPEAQHAEPRPEARPAEPRPAPHPEAARPEAKPAPAPKPEERKPPEKRPPEKKPEDENK